jgi:hypothetical protein
MRALGAISLTAVLCLLVVAAGCRSSSSDASGVFSAWMRAADERQLAQAEALFADEAVIDDGSGSSGPDRVHTWNAMVLDRFRLNLLRLTPVSSDHAQALITIASLQTARPVPIRTYQLDILVRGGKIQSMTWRVPGDADAASAPALPVPAADRVWGTPRLAAATIAAAVVVALALVGRARRRQQRPEAARGFLLEGLREFVAARHAPTPGQS